MSSHSCAALIGAAWVACVAAPAQAQIVAPEGAIFLDDALARALDYSPLLPASEAMARAADAAVRQADRGLNPTIDFVGENVLGTGAFRGLDRSESTLSYSQTLERGGDRQARTQLSIRQGERSRIEGDAAQQDFLHEVEGAFIDVQHAAVEHVVALESLGVAREVSEIVQRRVDAARDPLLASSRSLTLLADAEIAVERARQTEASAKQRLASYWGGSPAFEVETESFSRLGGVDASAADPSPELAAARAAEREADARIALEKARARQDPTVSAGVRYFQDDREAAFVLGLSIPLGVNDNNSSGVDRAAADSRVARLQTDMLTRSIERQAATQRSQMEIAASEIASLDARLIPAAEQAVERARQGYSQGGFSYLDVLDAQRVLADARLRRASAQSSYHHARIALKRLLGGYAASAAQ